MRVGNAHEGQGTTFAGYPTGFRRLTPGLLKVDYLAEGFEGLPEGGTMPGQLLAAFKGSRHGTGRIARLAELTRNAGSV